MNTGVVVVDGPGTQTQGFGCARYANGTCVMGRKDNQGDWYPEWEDEEENPWHDD